MMKDSPRRKIVDAIDFMTGDKNEPQIVEINIEKIVEFSDHPFHLYEGKRLDDMVESIKRNGVLSPVIVRTISSGKYEMLAGHNRMNAAKIANIDKIPALIKENLSDEEAYIYVIETNLMQRSFGDLYPSEKAVILEMQYDKVSSQGKRNDIISELKALEQGADLESVEPSTDSRERLAKEYGFSGRTVARLLRLNKLTSDWKVQVDNEVIALMTGVELSYLPESLQSHLYNECSDMHIKISLKDAQMLKERHQAKVLSKNELSKLLIEKEKSKLKNKDFQSIKVSKEIVSKYFDETTSKKEMKSIIVLALQKYFTDQEG